MSRDTHDEDLRQELLELHFGCHPDPEPLERRLQDDPQLRSLREEVLATAGVLEEAAHLPVPPLVLADVDGRSPDAPRRGWLPGPPWLRFAAAASLLLAAIVGILGLEVRGARSSADSLADQQLRLVVSGPAATPVGAPIRYRIETWDAGGGPRPARVRWTASNAAGQPLATNEAETDGTLDVTVPPAARAVASMSVVADAAGAQASVTLAAREAPAAPLVHLATDKALYRPGEPCRLRAVVLDRLSLAPREGSYACRIVDPRGIAATSFQLSPGKGAAAWAWSVPADAPGGLYAFEMRDTKNAFTFARQEFEVRRFERPRLEKRITLDRRTYAPGDRGTAEIAVKRVSGGAPGGARVDARVLLDGKELARERLKLDGAGKAVFAFQLPGQVQRGDGRIVARIASKSAVEAAMEPFSVPTGKVTAGFYPEGGDLVAGVENRVYFELQDSLERPWSGRGRLVDPSGRTLCAVATEHQGRGSFAFTPRAGVRYRVRLEGLDDQTRELPSVQASGVVLSALGTSAAAGGELPLWVHTPTPGPWLVSAFCRGAIVAQDGFAGSGAHDLRLDVPAQVGGVLRVTVFDRALQPVAERLVQVTGRRRIAVAVRPERAAVAPGEQQTVALRTTDETGRPVPAVLGVTVTDRAVEALADGPRIGLVDRTELLADVEQLEDVPDFLAHDDQARRRVDLLLGTRGWRRFAWRDPKALVAEKGDAARRLLLREGWNQSPVVKEARTGDEAALVAARARAGKAQDRFARFVPVAAFLLAALLLGRWFWLLSLNPSASPGARAAAAFAALLLIALCGISLSLLGGGGGAASGGLRPVAGWDEPAPAVVTAGAPLEDRDAAKFQLGLEAQVVPPMDAMAFGQELRALQAPVPQAGGMVDRDRRWDFWRLGRAPGAAGGVAARGLAGPGNLQVRRLLADIKNLPRTREFQAAARERLVLTRVYAHAQRPAGSRRDFTETVYWNPLLVTDEEGRARFSFAVSDAVTTWDVDVDAHGAGRVGQQRESFRAELPFHMAATLPVEVTRGDELKLPVAFVSSTQAAGQAGLSLAITGPASSNLPATTGVSLEAGQGRALVPLVITGAQESVRLHFAGTYGAWSDALQRELRTVPAGFPHHVARSGVLEQQEEIGFLIPPDVDPADVSLSLKLYPSPLATLVDGMEGMIRTPGGCFEQTSSANYPNVMALNYIEASGARAPALAAQARKHMDAAWRKLTGYECKQHGFEWWGGDPAHEALTAYGLVEFHDMAQVYAVDDALIARTRTWLMGRRDGRGGYRRNPRSLDRFGGAPAPVTDAYITWSLAVTGQDPASIAGELDRLARRAAESADPYEVAVATCALAAAGRADAAGNGRRRLQGFQQEDGSLRGTTTSITSSRGNDLAVETTSFAMLAWTGHARQRARVEAALRWLLAQRQGNGTFGGTQATIMALKALTAHARLERRATRPGTVSVTVNGAPPRRLPVTADGAAVLAFDDLQGSVTRGRNTLLVTEEGGNVLPWSLDLTYFAQTPADDPGCAVAIETELADDRATEGARVALDVTVKNVTEEGVPMTIAVVGLPAGLTITTATLEDLKKAGRFAAWERRGRDVVLYWRGLAPRAERRVTLDLLASTPGTTTGAASRAWLYYTSDQKVWAEPLCITIDPLN